MQRTRMAPASTFARVDGATARLHTARALAWTILLTGWIGLGTVAQTLTSGPLQAFAVLAVWLLSIGLFTEALRRFPPQRWLAVVLLLAAALSAASALHVAFRGGGTGVVIAAAMSWALLFALASATVRACRGPDRPQQASPVVAGAMGAALALWCIGDPTAVNAMGARLANGALIAALLLAALMPRSAVASSRGRSALLDGSIPAWARAASDPSPRWPKKATSLVMLPMMCSLPLMVGWCRGNGVSPELVLGLHLAAMFGPAVLLKLGHVTVAARAPAFCAVLLVLGGTAWALSPGASAWWWLALAHGGAWSVAWVASLEASDERPMRRPASGSRMLAAAMVDASVVLGLGSAVSVAGFDALAAAQVALAAIAATGLAALGSGLMPSTFVAKIRRSVDCFRRQSAGARCARRGISGWLWFAKRAERRIGTRPSTVTAAVASCRRSTRCPAARQRLRA
ncbi:hypothetical protein QN413_20135 [Variovorax sp. LG9.2]|nr:hypothetical protein [Variovorax sp. LG9.2]